MSLENLRLLSPYTVSLERVLRWENEELELQRHDGGFECRDGKKFLIYGVHAFLFTCC
jgi:hypothetical protein